VRNKMNSMLHRPLDLERRWYDVGQDPEQGNLNKNL
jgi:Fe-coproporphyrin III synthase